MTVPYDFDAISEAAVAAHGCVLDATPHVVAKSIDECFADVTAAVHAAASDDAEGARRVAEEIRAAVFTKTGGCSCSVGSASNMMLAKVATKLAKPDGHVHLSDAEAVATLRTLPATELPQIGRVNAAKLEALGLRTIADVADAPLAALEEALGHGKLAKATKQRAAGLDDRDWEPRPPRRSVGAQCSWGFRCRDAAHFLDLATELLRVATERAAKLKVEARATKVAVKVWKSKVPGEAFDASCKNGVGHGRCDRVHRTAAFDSIDAAGDALLAIVRGCGVDAVDVRGLGVSLLLDDAAPLRDEEKITHFFRASPKKRRAVVSAAPLVLVAVGLPGAGKSTFFETFLEGRGVHRCCQDVLKRREKVEAAVEAALDERAAAYVDRTNLTPDQRAHWVRIAKARGARVVALVFCADADACARRCATRTGHEGRLDARNPAQCKAIVSRMSKQRRTIAKAEAFDDVHNVTDDAGASEALADALLGPREAAAADAPAPPPTKRPRTRPPPPPPPPPGDAAAPWGCATCTYRHDGHEAAFLACAVCGASKAPAD